MLRSHQYALYDRIRTYEVVSQDLPKKEVLLTIDERPSKRARGAYYKDINMRTSLRKTRVNVSLDNHASLTSRDKSPGTRRVSASETLLRTKWMCVVKLLLKSASRAGSTSSYARSEEPTKQKVWVRQFENYTLRVAQ